MFDLEFNSRSPCHDLMAASIVLWILPYFTLQSFIIGHFCCFLFFDLYIPEINTVADTCCTCLLGYVLRRGIAGLSGVLVVKIRDSTYHFEDSRIYGKDS